MMRKILFVILMLMIAANTLAVGVAPSRKMIDFEPGKVITGEVRVVNPYAEDFSFIVYPSSNIAPYIEIENQKIKIDMSSDEFEKVIKYKLTLPEELEPGTMKGLIVVSELAKEDQDEMVTSLLTLNSQLIINVPYEGKYIKPQLYVTSEGENTLFTLSLFNLGDEQIDNVRAIINVKSLGNEDIISIDTNTLALNPSGNGKLTGKWEGIKNNGKYVAEIILLYDGKTEKIYKEFEVGKTTITIRDFIASDFRLGAIAKFDMTIRNNWNEKIESLNAELTISKEGKVIDRIRSLEESVDPYDDVVLSAYWDTAGIQAGNYNVLAKVLFDDNTYEEPFEIYVSQDKIVTNKLSAKAVSDENDSTVVKVLVILVISLIIVNISWLLVYFKKKNGGQK